MEKAHGQGDIVTDLQGRRYIDTQLWHFSGNVGYQDPAITKAVHHQQNNVSQVMQRLAHPLVGDHP